MKKLLLALIACFTLTSTHQQAAPKALAPAQCLATCRLADGSKIGPQHNDIERAGVILLVPIKSPISKHPFDQWGIIIDHDKNLATWMVGQAGGREKTDHSVAHTAARELLEETGGHMKLSPQTISKLPYIYGGKKQLFMYKTTSTSLASAIKNSVQAAQKNSKLGHSFKEIDDIAVVSVNDFLDLANKIDQNKVQTHQYIVETQDGRTITLEKFYTQIFGHPKDHDRYKNAKLLFQSLCQ